MVRVLLCVELYAALHLSFHHHHPKRIPLFPFSVLLSVCPFPCLLWSQARCALVQQAGDSTHLSHRFSRGVGVPWLQVSLAVGQCGCVGDMKVLLQRPLRQPCCRSVLGFPFVVFMDCFAWVLFSGFLAYPNQFCLYNALILFVFLFMYISLYLHCVVYVLFFFFFKDFKKSFFLLFL